MTLTEDEVIQILKLVEQSTFDELHLETGELKLVVRKQGCGTAFVENNTAPVSPAPSRAPGVSRGQTDQEVPNPARARVRRQQRQQSGKGWFLSKHPCWVRSTGGRRLNPLLMWNWVPYVKEDDTVCLIEVMKVFTAVKAGVRGRITDVLIETNEMVEYGQPLFMVKPEAGPA